MKTLTNKLNWAILICVFGMGLGLPTLIDQVLQGRSWWLTALNLLVLSLGLWQLWSIQNIIKKEGQDNAVKGLLPLGHYLLVFLLGTGLAVLLWQL